MELLFETRRDLLRVPGNMHFFVRKGQVSPEPVLVGDSKVDELGAHIYGSVHHDGGVCRIRRAEPTAAVPHPRCPGRATIFSRHVSGGHD